MDVFFGLDTSNYTTSAALYAPEAGIMISKKRLLPVRPGEKGIRQSDAVFYHTQQLPEMVRNAEEEAPDGSLLAVGASAWPRRVEGSYMPCFLVGTANAGNMAAAAGVPFYAFSHQEGHIAAALFSAKRTDLLGSDFLAFHVSGGTTESLFVTRGERVPIVANQVGTSTDLKAGMAIDRVGVMLGLPFPAGPALEELSARSTKTYHIRPSGRDLDCSLSGVENQCRKLLEIGEAPEDIALYCLRYVEATLIAMTSALTEHYPGLPVLFSGGVMSNRLIRSGLSERCDAWFAEPQYSADNAAGVALLTALCAQRGADPDDPVALCASRRDPR